MITMRKTENDLNDLLFLQKQQKIWPHFIDKKAYPQGEYAWYLIFVGEHDGRSTAICFCNDKDIFIINRM